MDISLKTVNLPEKLTDFPKQEKEVTSKDSLICLSDQKRRQLQQQPSLQKSKRKHRRGKPKAKNANKLYKKTNWRFQMPRLNYGKCGSAGSRGGYSRREKLQRSRSLVPYNTNKFLMEEHLAEVPGCLLTPSGRTRDSSLSMDSEDNYFFSLPEDEEEFLTKEFANVYEKARVERLECLSKQQLIEECLQIEDRYSKDQGNQRQQQLNIQRISQEYTAKIRVLEEKVKELSRENHNMRCQLMRSAACAAAAAASPPSAAAPMGAACQPTPMDSSSEDSESDSSTSSSSSSSSSSAISEERNQPRRESCSPHSSSSEYNGYVENNYMPHNQEEEPEACVIRNIEQHQLPTAAVRGEDFERQQLLNDHMDDDGDGNNEYVENIPKLNDNRNQSEQGLFEQPGVILLSDETRPSESNDIQIIANNSRGNMNVVESLQNPLN